jgi:hypothetical protein
MAPDLAQLGPLDLAVADALQFRHHDDVARHLGLGEGGAACREDVLGRDTKEKFDEPSRTRLCQVNKRTCGALVIGIY